ncbi:hypothetical protein CEXT_813731 [Caerostris extrusa]|uniref:Uncharacterized protein n=1 Tax=Caerostris extrusa TaxID=172846 RepID=A0AAV4U4C2_CAEEX|nr:hypothetical protein CEXT_813731 [Caerostris extrusa]
MVRSELFCLSYPVAGIECTVVLLFHYAAAQKCSFHLTFFFTLIFYSVILIQRTISPLSVLGPEKPMQSSAIVNCPREFPDALFYKALPWFAPSCFVYPIRWLVPAQRRVINRAMRHRFKF